MLVLCIGDKAKDGELLFAELGSIVQTMQRRLGQEEFEKTSLFPVSHKIIEIPMLTIHPGLRRYSSSRSLAHGIGASYKPGSLSLAI